MSNKKSSAIVQVGDIVEIRPRAMHKECVGLKGPILEIKKGNNSTTNERLVIVKLDKVYRFGEYSVKLVSRPGTIRHTSEFQIGDKVQILDVNVFPWISDMDITIGQIGVVQQCVTSSTSTSAINLKVYFKEINRWFYYAPESLKKVEEDLSECGIFEKGDLVEFIAPNTNPTISVEKDQKLTFDRYDMNSSIIYLKEFPNNPIHISKIKKCTPQPIFKKGDKIIFTASWGHSVIGGPLVKEGDVCTFHKYAGCHSSLFQAKEFLGEFPDHNFPITSIQLYSSPIFKTGDYVKNISCVGRRIGTVGIIVDDHSRNSLEISSFGDQKHWYCMSHQIEKITEREYRLANDLLKSLIPKVLPIKTESKLLDCIGWPTMILGLDIVSNFKYIPDIKNIAAQPIIQQSIYKTNKPKIRLKQEY
jgi:signal peptidase I